ncbi:hypothetical protein LCGC14_1235240 [marine sediment metagenome]|uniref:Uncharacterized protein n=1 Tax=marine sediment metagenome TaxID=412755 RepID=A0A0F9L7C4_9ZZZZ
MKHFLLALTFLTLSATIAQADSLVCQYFIGGEYKTLVYTEVEDAKPNQIKVAYSHKAVIFGNGSTLQFGQDTDCVFIKDRVGKEQVALNHFLEQIGIGGLE